MNGLFLCLIPGVAFGVWPLIMRATGFGPLLSFFILTFTSLICIIPATYFFPEAIPHAPKGALIGAIAGTINGIGCFVYLKLISFGKEAELLGKATELSKIIPMVTIIIVVVAFLGAYLFYNEPITLKKIGGVAAAILAVILLN